MDRGQFVKMTFRVEPALNGGVICILGGTPPYQVASDVVSFSSPDDFMRWLSDEYAAAKPSKPETGCPTRFIAPMPNIIWTKEEGAV